MQMWRIKRDGHHQTARKHDTGHDRIGGVAMLAALILFSRFALGVEIFRCMSGESHAARASCLQSIAVEHLNRRF
jgi:hypothetical protein